MTLNNFPQPCVKQTFNQAVYANISIFALKCTPIFFQVSIDGQTVTADTTSFKAKKDPAYKDVPTKDTTGDHLSVYVVVGIVVGVIVLVILLVFLLCCCLLKQKNKKQRAIAPQPARDVELNG